MIPVFVYGTLKQGFPNFHINKGKRIDGDFYTKNCYPFYLVGERYVPWLVLDEGKDHRVRGQLYKVDAETMESMDELESIGKPDGYSKVQISITSSNIAAGKEVLAYIYVKSVTQLQNADIKVGPLKEYELEHSLLYSRHNE